MTVKTRIQLRRDTAANWTSTNPTLSAGEVGVETDTGKFKIGDGSTAWLSLDEANPTDLVTEITGSTTDPLAVSGGTLSLQGGFARYVDGSDTHVTYPKVTVKSGSTGPAAPAVGDVWIKF